MPNWKKLITSGSDANLNSLTVVGTVSAGKVGLGSTSPNNNLHIQADVNGEGLTIQRASSTADTFGELAFLQSTSTVADPNLWIRGYRGSDFASSYLTVGTNNTERIRIDSNGNIGIGTGSSDEKLVVNGNVSASAFIGDGSALTGITSDISETATIADSFSNQTTVVTSHNFGTKNVQVTVYDDNDAMIIPDSIVTTDTNTVTTTFDSSTTGRVVVGKAGHIVSGSTQTYRQSITGASSYAVTHSLSEDYPIVQVYSSSRAQVIPSEIITTSANALDITFTSTFNGTVVVKK